MTEIKLPSGVTLRAECGVFGVTQDLELTEGYDNFFSRHDNDGEDFPLSLEDKQFIAKMMIERWQRFAGIGGNMTVTDKMVQAAKFAYFNEVHHGPGFGDERYRAAIEAALAVQAKQGPWQPIADADKEIAYFHDLGELKIGNSYPIWARDADGRVYEALWSDNGKTAFWWDIEGESPVDPVEFMPHPLSKPKPGE